MYSGALVSRSVAVAFSAVVSLAATTPQDKTNSQLLTPDDVRSESGNALSWRNLFFTLSLMKKTLGAQNIKKTQRE